MEYCTRHHRKVISTKSWKITQNFRRIHAIAIAHMFFFFFIFLVFWCHFWIVNAMRSLIVHMSFVFTCHVTFYGAITNVLFLSRCTCFGLIDIILERKWMFLVLIWIFTVSVLSVCTLVNFCSLSLWHFVCACFTIEVSGNQSHKKSSIWSNIWK